MDKPLIDKNGEPNYPLINKLFENRLPKKIWKTYNFKQLKELNAYCYKALQDKHGNYTIKNVTLWMNNHKKFMNNPIDFSLGMISTHKAFTRRSRKKESQRYMEGLLIALMSNYTDDLRIKVKNRKRVAGLHVEHKGYLERCNLITDSKEIFIEEICEIYLKHTSATKKEVAKFIVNSTNIGLTEGTIKNYLSNFIDK